MTPVAEQTTSPAPAREPVRMCVACRRRRPQRELVRIAHGPDGVWPDPEGGRPGRGAYVCPESSCVDGARRGGGKSLRRALRGGTDEEVLRALDQVETAPPKEREA